MDWILQNWEPLFGLLILVTAGTPLGRYIMVLRKVAAELVELIDRSPVANKTFLAAAQKDGKREAEKVLARLPGALNKGKR